MSEAVENNRDRIEGELSDPPATYFSLMEKVGSRGKYQNILTVIFGFTWYVTGIILMSTAFLFLNPHFDCEQYGLLADSCSEYVCSLPASEWEGFVSAKSQQFKSLANSFDETFFCQDEFYLNLYSSFAYFGALIGYVVISVFSDNWGRRKTLIMSWSITCLGITILLFSNSVLMAALGLFFSGIGSDSTLDITMVIIHESYDSSLRQRVQTSIQGCFTTGALIVTLIYYLFQDWWITTLYAVWIPAILTLFFIILMLQQTPMFLVLSGAESALKAFNRIGKLNKGKVDCLTLEQVQKVTFDQQVVEYDRFITPLDLCRFTSLRLITICCGIASISTFMMYYGPIFIVDQIGFDMYTSNVIYHISDLLHFYPLIMLIGKIKRRKSCIILFGLSTILSGLLLFVAVPQDCGLVCAELIFQLIFVFVFRFSISMVFTIKIIYSNQLYPTRSRSIGNGILGSLGTAASSLCPILMGLMTRNNINPFILFTILGVFATASMTFLRETHNMPMLDEIQQVEIQKLKRKSFHQSDPSKSKLK